MKMSKEIHKFHEEDVNYKFKIANSGFRINDPLARYLISHLVPVELLHIQKLVF